MLLLIIKADSSRDKKRARELFWWASVKRTLNAITYPSLGEMVNCMKGYSIPELLKKKFVQTFFSLRKDLAIVDEGMAGKFVKDRYVKEIYRVSPLTGSFRINEYAEVCMRGRTTIL
jgi:hypothetical protein